jgi:hypothetical protein
MSCRFRSPDTNAKSADRIPPRPEAVCRVPEGPSAMELCGCGCTRLTARFAIPLLALAVVVGGCRSTRQTAPFPDGLPVASFDTPVAGQPDSASTGLRVLHAYLAERLGALESRSSRFAAAMNDLRDAPFPIVVGTPEQVGPVGARGGLLGPHLRRTRVGEFAAVAEPDGETVRRIDVWISLDRLAERLRGSVRSRRFSSEDQRELFEQLVDAVLIHEIWGHVVPVASARVLSAHCSDPWPGEDPLASCVMQRENDLRVELGLEPRASYPLRVRRRRWARIRTGQRTAPG